ncbi:HET-domain-containing protein, partial [Cadophora sp. DSE1049]
MSFPPYEQPLDTSLRQIRLLDILPEPHPIDGRLQCHFTIESLLQDPDDLPYQALSYTWGRPDDFDFKIWLNGILFPVRQNLLCALRVLRASGDTIKLPIWIDALCIDQQNVSERGHQVDMMGVIYRGAQHVIAWLG